MLVPEFSFSAYPEEKDDCKKDKYKEGGNDLCKSSPFYFVIKEIAVLGI